MAFFPRNHHNAEVSFTPLFRLLEDFDSYSRQGQNGRSSPSRAAAIAFQPKFDVRELKGHFELHGELAGLRKENVDIEFTDPHTLRIHGRVERSYTTTSPNAGLVENSPVDADDNQSTTSAKSHQATVEDEDVEWTSNDGAETPGTEVQKEPTQKTPSRAQPKAADSAKYWCSERSIGEFSRTFNFPGQIQQDAVSANLVDGILTIKVPKAPKHETRRIAIQ